MEKISYLVAFVLLFGSLWTPAADANKKEPQWYNYISDTSADHIIGFYDVTGYKYVVHSKHKGAIEEEFVALELKKPIRDADRDYLIFSLASNNSVDVRADIEIYESEVNTSFSFSQDFEDGFIPIWLHFAEDDKAFEKFLENNYLSITYTTYDQDDNITAQFTSTNIIFESFKHNEIDKQAKTSNAEAKQSTLIIDGKEHKVDTYTIDNSTYFKLRDIAALLNNTNKSFNVKLNPELSNIIIEDDTAYNAVGGELTPLKNKSTKKVKSKHNLLDMDNILYSTWAYNIDGYNYFKLRDIGDIVGFETSWNSRLGAIEIKTN